MTTKRLYQSALGMPMQDITMIAPKRSAQTAPRVPTAERKPAVHSSRTQHSTMLSRRYVRQPNTMHTPKRQVTAPQRAKQPLGQRRNDRAQTTRQQPTPTHHTTPITPAKPITRPLSPTTAGTGEPKSPIAPEAPKAPLTRAVQNQRQQRRRQLLTRWISLATAGLAVILLVGYITYLNMPHISLRIAAMQSGVNAKYPQYQPAGYALHGPISFKEGEVTMQFADTAEHSQYTLTQQKTNWNSEALKQQLFHDNPAISTTVVDGLTLYADGTLAAWVNRGILYRVDSNQPLANDQLQKIATSM